MLIVVAFDAFSALESPIAPGIDNRVKKLGAGGFDSQLRTTAYSELPQVGRTSIFSHKLVSHLQICRCSELGNLQNNALNQLND